MSIKDMKKFERWRKSLQYLTGLGMSKEEQTEFRKALDVEIESYQCNQCENWRDNLMKNSKCPANMNNKQKTSELAYLEMFYSARSICAFHG